MQRKSFMPKMRFITNIGNRRYLIDEWKRKFYENKCYIDMKEFSTSGGEKDEENELIFTDDKGICIGTLLVDSNDNFSERIFKSREVILKQFAGASTNNSLNDALDNNTLSGALIADFLNFTRDGKMNIDLFSDFCRDIDFPLELGCWGSGVITLDPERLYRRFDFFKKFFFLFQNYQLLKKDNKDKRQEIALNEVYKYFTQCLFFTDFKQICIESICTNGDVSYSESDEYNLEQSDALVRLSRSLPSLIKTKIKLSESYIDEEYNDNDSVQNEEEKITLIPGEYYGKLSFKTRRNKLEEIYNGVVAQDSYTYEIYNRNEVMLKEYHYPEDPEVIFVNKGLKELLLNNIVSCFKTTNKDFEIKIWTLYLLLSDYECTFDILNNNMDNSSEFKFPDDKSNLIPFLRKLLKNTASDFIDQVFTVFYGNCLEWRYDNKHHEMNVHLNSIEDAVYISISNIRDLKSIIVECPRCHKYFFKSVNDCKTKFCNVQNCTIPHNREMQKIISLQKKEQ